MNKFESEKNKDLKSLNLLYGLVRAFLEIPFDDEEVSSKEKLEVLSQILSDYNKVDISENKVHLTSEQSNNKTRIYAVDKASWKLFEHLYDIKSGISLDDLKLLQSNRDRFLNEEERRRGGDFYTPRLWVKEGHKLLSERLGENWENEYIVWDCCCGTGNLTRGLSCTKILTTLDESDLEIAKWRNKRTIVYSYDFLNDDIKEIGSWNGKVYKDVKIKDLEDILRDFDGTKMTDKYKNGGDTRLLKLLLTGRWNENDDRYKANKTNSKPKKLLILINPPYGSARTGSNSNSKDGISDTKVKLDAKTIKKDNLQDLYAQFMYRILGIIKQFPNCDITIASYIKTTFWTGSKTEEIRNAYAKEGYYLDSGFMFSGKEFNGCKNNWSLCFTILRKDKNKICNILNDIIIKVKKNVLNDNVLNILNISDKLLYSLTINDRLFTWIKEDNKSLELFSGYMKYKTPLNKFIEIEPGGRAYNNMLGFLRWTGNALSQSASCFCYSCVSDSSHGTPILSTNYDNVMCGYSAMQLYSYRNNPWIQSCDELIKPDVNNIKYVEYLLDSTVYMMFYTRSYYMSLRNIIFDTNLEPHKRGNIEYLGNNLWNVYNEFFWMGRNEIEELNKKDFIQEIDDDLYETEDSHKESFTYLNKIKPNISNFSTEAKQVLDLATSLVKLSFSYRKEAIKIHPDWHLSSWDAGWYQIKKLIESDICKKDINLQQTYKNFKSSLSALQDKMKPMVYELGFLK